VVLPEDCVPDGSGNPLAKRPDFVNCACPKCGQPARRETDTMDTFVDSSWYYARFCVRPDAKDMVDAGTGYWMPVDQYIGGIEHAILHLLYSRFWTKVMRDVGLVKYDEPFANLLTQGMVLNHIFFRRNDKGGIDYLSPEEVNVTRDDAGRIAEATLADGRPVEYGGIGTMSKSKKNGVDPQSLIETYGADTARFFMMFASPPEQTLEWSDSGVEGAARFLNRLWRFAVEVEQQSQGATAADLAGAKLPAGLADARREVHATLRKANRDFAVHQFNTVASGAMIILNALEGVRAAGEPAARVAVLREGLSILLRLLAPLTPHVSHHLWRELGYGEDILAAPWPEPDAAALEADEVELVVQVNGKKRADVRVPKAADRAAIEAIVLANAAVQKFIEGQSVKKVIVVPGRLVNVVV
jgi:leucyl-tRNA synthetase